MLGSDHRRRARGQGPAAQALLRVVEHLFYLSSITWGLIVAIDLAGLEIVMPVIVVTRLRLRAPELLDEFFTDAVAAIEQAMKSKCNLGADALADANNAWWSVSAWQERRLMQAYVDS
jgi:hypothetical protein